MRYIENDGYKTCEYDIKINTSKLEKVIKELDSKCYRIIDKTINVTALSKEDAIRKINMITNAAGEKVNDILSISEGYKDMVNYPNSPFIFDCKCLHKESSDLVIILRKLLNNYLSKLDFKKENNRLLDLLFMFESNIHFNMSSENDYNYELLHELYEKALDCFNGQLISETIHSKNKVYIKK